MKPRHLIAPFLLAAATVGDVPAPKTHQQGCESDILFCRELMREERFARYDAERARTDAVDRVREHIRDLQAESFNTLVPNARVRDMASTFFGVSLRGNTTDYMTGHGHEVAYTGVVGPEFYDSILEETRCHGTECKNSPEASTLSSLFGEVRSTIMEKAKAHLSQPDNLMSFYQAKKSIILEELHDALEYDGGKDKEKKLANLLRWMNNLETAVKALDDPRFDSAYQNYLQAEQALIEARPDYASQFGGISEQVRYDDKIDPEIDKQHREKIPAYAKYRETQAALEEITPDLDATMFAARRRAENPKILKTYLEILADLRKEVEAIQ